MLPLGPSMEQLPGRGQLEGSAPVENANLPFPEEKVDIIARPNMV